MCEFIAKRGAVRVTAVLLSMLLAVLVLAPGCTESEPEQPVVEPPPPPPPPKTAEQLVQEWQGDLLVLFAPGVTPSPAQVREIVEGLKNKARAETWGNKALTILASDVKNQLDTAHSQAEAATKSYVDAPSDAVARTAAADAKAQWARVLMLCNALDALDPDSARTARVRQAAEQAANRPRVSIKNWTETNGNTFVTLELDFPARDARKCVVCGKPKSEHDALRTTDHMFDNTLVFNVQEGEEFGSKSPQVPNNLRLVSIVGNRSGVLLEYLPAKETFEVKSRR